MVKKSKGRDFFFFFFGRGVFFNQKRIMTVILGVSFFFFSLCFSLSQHHSLLLETHWTSVALKVCPVRIVLSTLPKCFEGVTRYCYWKCFMLQLYQADIVPRKFGISPHFAQIAPACVFDDRDSARDPRSYCILLWLY